MKGTVRDITERKRSEVALRESEERFRGLVEGFGQFSWEARADGIIVTDSTGWRAFTGQRLEEWQGSGWLQAIHADDRAATKSKWEAAVAAGKAVDAEYRLLHVWYLLAANARVDALDGTGQTPLERCLGSCSNAALDRAADVAAALLDAGAQATPSCRVSVTRIGERFEFHRDGFNPDSVGRMSEALDRLYALFDVTPVSRRTMHDGTSPIVAVAERWEDRSDELGQRLVPSSGAARNVQGEVVRLAGKIRRELDGNGGVNWDGEFRRMADAWLDHVVDRLPS